MRHFGFRKILPVLLGSIAVALMVWDYHNQRVIESMGMAWDIGAPIWPYLTSWILLVAINAPAYLLSAPFFFLLNLQTVYGRYPLQFLSILLLWWWVGSRIDWGLLGRRNYRHPRLISFLLSTAAVVLLYFCIGNAVHDARVWFRFRGDRSLLESISLLTSFGLLIWSIAFGFGAARAAVSLIKGNYGKYADTIPRQKSLRRALIPLLIVVFAMVIGIIIEYIVLQP